MKNALISADYNGLSVTFNQEGWFNATLVAANFGKRPVDFLALDGTQEYLRILQEELRSEDSSLLKIHRGGRGKTDSTWMHPELAVAFARWLDVRFSIWCDRQIKQILLGQHPHFDFKRAREAASVSFKVLTDVLHSSRESAGKETLPYHYSNEARLLNHALTGDFGKVDRDTLPVGELRILKKLEIRSAALIAMGLPYEQRKAELEELAVKLRAKASLSSRGSDAHPSRLEVLAPDA